jgi:hypothetical protein
MSAIDQQRILALIYDSIDEVNQHFAQANRLPKDPGTLLLSRLDSLGFVNLIAAIEERCESTLNVTISLANASQGVESDPFVSVATLAEFLEVALKPSAARSDG